MFLSMLTVAVMLIGIMAAVIVPVLFYYRFVRKDMLHAYRYSMVIIFGIVILYAVLILAPFYVSGTYLQPAEAIASGAYDPKNLPISQTIFGSVGRLSGMIVGLVGMPLLAASAVGMAFSARAAWKKLPTTQRLWGVSALGVAMSMIAFMLSPVGRLIVLWYFD